MVTLTKTPERIYEAKIPELCDFCFLRSQKFEVTFSLLKLNQGLDEIRFYFNAVRLEKSQGLSQILSRGEVSGRHSHYKKN